MGNKSMNVDKIYTTYLLMCVINFLIILFVSAVMYITTQRICDMQSARTFLASVQTLPKNSMSIITTALLSFFVLLCMMNIRSKMKFNSYRLAFFFLIEAGLCLLIMNTLSFSTNAIVLLVIADLLTYLNSNRYRFAFLGCMIVFYIVANYDFLSAKVAMVSFYDYISCYDSVTKSILLSIQNVLSSLNIIAFIIYMILLVQDKINENKKFVEMNDELKNLNSQLKEYANIREKMGETRERNRLAREIHDTLGHTLTGLSVGLDASVLTCVIDPDTTKKQLMVLRDSAKRGLNDVRRSVDKLRPDALEHYSLKEAIDQMIVEFSELTDIEIHFVCHLPNLKFDADEEEIIYRIIQESMTNSVRHGHAHKIYISIAKEKNMLILIIEDDGIGCQHIKPDFGLHHMKERIELLQGNIRFYGYDGFIIIAEIPIREESKL
ncbi:MAG: sensor histidine kinase [Longicatena sp.]